MQVQGFYVTQGVYASPRLRRCGAAGRTAPPILPLASTLYRMDIPLLQADRLSAGCLCRRDRIAGLDGREFVAIIRHGVNYNNVASFSSAAVAGIAVTALGNQSCPVYG